MQKLAPLCSCSFRGDHVFSTDDRVSPVNRLIRLHDYCVDSLASGTPQSLANFFRAFTDLNGGNEAWEEVQTFIDEHDLANREALTDLMSIVSPLFQRGLDWAIEHYEEITTVPSYVDVATRMSSKRVQYAS